MRSCFCLLIKSLRRRRTLTLGTLAHFSHLILSLAIACAVTLALAALHAKYATAGVTDHPAGETAPATASRVHLYFTDDSNSFLTAEQRKVLHGPDTAAFAAAIVRALINGPQKTLVRTIPAGTKLKAIYVLANGRCYVDLSSRIRDQHPGGCNTELLTVYSVVNSLILNISQIKTVKLLIDGAEVPTLAGHVDLQSSVAANMLLIR